MSSEDIIRAWKDEEYRASLSEAIRASLPQHPAGLIELTDAALDEVAGGTIVVKSISISVSLTRFPAQSINALACFGNPAQTVVVGPGPVG